MTIDGLGPGLNHSIVKLSILQSFNLSIFQSFNLSIFQSFSPSIVSAARSGGNENSSYKFESKAGGGAARGHRDRSGADVSARPRSGTPAAGARPRQGRPFRAGLGRPPGR